MKATFTAVFTECEEGGYAVTVNELPVISTQGDTMEEAQQNLILAIEDYAEYLAWKRQQEPETQQFSVKAIHRPLTLSIA